MRSVTASGGLASDRPCRVEPGRVRARGGDRHGRCDPGPASGEAMTCAKEGCERDVPASAHHRIYCSSNCRKRACAERHRRACTDCGSLMSDRSGWHRGGRENERCRACHLALRRMAEQAKLEDVAVMYREGMKTKDIAAKLGYAPGSQPPEITRCFERGLLTDADRRYSLERVANMKAGRKA